MLFLLVFKTKHNLRVICSNVYKVFKQLQSQPQPQHTVLGSRILRKLSIDVLVALRYMAHVFLLGHYNQVESVLMFLVPSGIPGRLDQSYFG